CAATTPPAGWKCATALRLCRKSVHTGKSILISQESRTRTIAANVATTTDRNPGHVAAVIALHGWSRNSQTPASRSSNSCGRSQYVGKLTTRLSYAHFTSYTVFPPTTVRNTLVPRTFSGATAVTSRSRTTKSASISGASVPFSFSANSAKADPVV